MIKEESINEVYEISLTSVVERYLKLDKNSKAKCPFHKENSASFAVNERGHFFKCFGCGEGGSGPIDFLMKIEKAPFVEAVETLADMYNITLQYDEKFSKAPKKNKEARVIYAKLLQFAQSTYGFDKAKPPKEIKSFCKIRGIDLQTAKYFGIGFAPDDWQTLTSYFVEQGTLEEAKTLGLTATKNQRNYDLFKNRITFPIHDHRGQLVGFGARAADDSFPKYKNSAESPLYSKSKILYNLNRAIPFIKNAKGLVYLVEGYMDAIALRKLGIENVIATCGTALTKEQAKLLSRFAKKVVIWYDGDQAGRAATHKAIESLRDAKLGVAVLNMLYMDPDDYSRKIVKDKGAKAPLAANREIKKLQAHALDWAIELEFRPWFSFFMKEIDVDLRKELKSQEAAIEEFAGEELEIQSRLDLSELLTSRDAKYTMEEYSLPSEERSAALKNVLKMLMTYSIDIQEEYVEILNNISGVSAVNIQKMLKGIAVKYTRHAEEKKKPKDTLKQDKREEFEKYGFYEAGGCYVSIDFKGSWVDVSNFAMEILYHVNTGRDEAYRLLKLKNIFGLETVINMNTDDFISLASFRKIIARKGNYLWKGRESDLIRLQDKLQREEKSTRMVNILGYNPRGKFFAFANGIIDLESLESGETKFKPVDEYGIVEHGDENFFIPYKSKIYENQEDMFLNYRKFVYKPNKLPLATWFKQFHGSFGDNAILGFMFFVSAIFSDTIFLAMSRRFPILFLYGPRGSGKGTYAQSLLTLLGEPQHAIMLGGNTTGVGFMRSFAQFRNSIVWADEYKNNLHKKIIENLKNVYDRTGYTRGKKDHTFDTDVTPVYSAAIVSGQEMPTIEPAFFQRVMMLVFEETKRTAEKKEIFRDLQAMENKGLSHLTVHILRHAPYFKEKFKETFIACSKELSHAVKGLGVDDRFIENYACLLATCKLLLDRERIGLAYEKFQRIVEDTLKRQHFIFIGNDDISKFWRTVESLFMVGAIMEEREFEIHDGKLYIRIQNIVGLYQKELRNQNDSNGLDKATLENQLQLNKEIFIERTKRKFKKGSYTHCMVFWYDKLDIGLISFGEGGSALSRQKKYKEMGVKDPEEEERQKQPTNDKIKDLPFT